MYVKRKRRQNRIANVEEHEEQGKETYLELNQEGEDQENDLSAKRLCTNGQWSSQPELERSLRDSSRSVEADVGIIEEITLFNFMCHKHFRLQFGPRVNFIVGQNGSGKSAILVALTIGLGAKAGFSNRGAKITDLIRQGSNSSTILIRLRNRGQDAYQPEQYGECIFVERKIAKEGGSTYRLKSSAGKVIATSVSELNNILDHFNIQINNPCSILMQDTSRQFLTTSSARDKYKFFLMATQLDQMEKDFKSIYEQLQNMESNLTRKEKVIPDMEKQVLEYEKEYRELHTIRELEEKMETLKKMMAWAQVEEARKEMDVAEKDWIKLKKEQAKYVHAIGLLQEKQKKLEADVEQKDTFLSDFQAKLTQVQQEKVSLEKTLHDAKKKVAQQQGKVNDSKKRMEHLVKRKENVQKHIEDLQKKNAEDASITIEARQREVEARRISLETLMEKHKQEERHRQELDEHLRDTEAIDQLRREEDAERKKHSMISAQLKNYEIQKRNKDKVFGDFVPILLESIKKNSNRFSKVPIGPIGLRMQIKDDRWAKAIESCLGGKVLKYFIVDNSKDERVFREIVKSIKCSETPGVYLFPLENSLYSIPERELPNREQFTTIMDMLEVDHPSVMNLLIDQCKIEKKILIQDLSEAKQVMFSSVPPANVKECYIANGTKLFLQGRDQYIVPTNMRRRFFGINFDEQIREHQQQLRQIEINLKSISEEKEKIEAIRIEWRKQKDSSSVRFRDQQMEINQLEKDIKEIQNIREESLSDVSELEENLHRIEKDISEMEKEYEKDEKQLLVAREATKPLEEQLSEKVRLVDQFGEEKDAITEGVKKTATELQDTIMKIERLQTSERDFENKISRAHSQLQDKQKEFQITKNKAIQFCEEEVQVEKSCSALDKEILALQKRISKEKEGHRDATQITRQYTESKQKLEEIKTTLSRLRSLKASLEHNFKERVLSWKRFRKSIALQTNLLFNAFLSQKGFSGNLSFDYEKEELSVSVELDQIGGIAKQQKRTRDTKSLSGGERSYSTVSLLLALWEAMECPFSAMDEFDVFMDVVNRSISIRLLIESTKDHPKRQFIFITPHDYK